MDLTSWSRANPPDFDAMAEIGQFLLSSLGRYLAMSMVPFREHYVEEGSIAVTFYASILVSDPALPVMEGTAMFDVASGNAPPFVDAELLLFSGGRRLSPAGMSCGFLQAHYDHAAGWGPLWWDWDSSEDWEAVTEPRTADYDTVLRTYDRIDG